MIHLLSLVAALEELPALSPAGRRTPRALPSEVATPSLLEQEECRTPPAPRSPPPWATLSASPRPSILLPRSRRPSTRPCPRATPTSTAEWEECRACSTEEVWPGAESTLPPTLAYQSPRQQDRPAPHSSRTRRPTAPATAPPTTVSAWDRAARDTSTRTTGATTTRPRPDHPTTLQAPQATGAQPFGKFGDQLYRW